jgi:Flp pilus assembly protein TadD
MNRLFNRDFIRAMRSLNGLAPWALCALLIGVPVHAQTNNPPKVPSVAETIQQWLNRGAPEEALKVADKHLQLYPNDPNLKFQRAVILERLNQPDQAQAAYVALTQDHPELSEPQNNLGALLAKKNLLPEARERFELALRADPNNRMAQENLADVWLRMADAQYRKLKATEPGNARLQRKIDALQAPIQALKEAR